MIGTGMHAEIVCKANFPREKSATISLHLFKERPETESSAPAWNYQAEL